MKIIAVKFLFLLSIIQILEATNPHAIEKKEHEIRKLLNDINGVGKIDDKNAIETLMNHSNKYFPLLRLKFTDYDKNNISDANDIKKRKIPDANSLNLGLLTNTIDTNNKINNNIEGDKRAENFHNKVHGLASRISTVMKETTHAVAKPDDDTTDRKSIITQYSSSSSSSDGSSSDSSDSSDFNYQFKYCFGKKGTKCLMRTPY